MHFCTLVPVFGYLFLLWGIGFFFPGPNWFLSSFFEGETFLLSHLNAATVAHTLLWGPDRPVTPASRDS